MNLYNISTTYQFMLENIHDENGEINEAALIMIDEHKDAMNNKCIAISSYIKNLLAEEKAVKEAEKSMQERRKGIENRTKFLEEYLKTNMERCGISEIKCPQFIIKVKKNPLSVNVFDEKCLPAKYFRIVTETKVDKKLIKEDIENGEYVPGAMLKQNTRIDIK